MSKLSRYSLFAAGCVSLAMYAGCGSESSSSPSTNMTSTNNMNRTALPDTVSSLGDLLANYVCDEALKCKGTYLLDMGYAVCDGDGDWTFGSLIHDMGCGIDYVPGYDEPLSSSSTTEEDVSSSSLEEESSSSISEESSSSDGTKYERKVVCSAVAEGGACDAMDRTDVSTWHFVGKDAFGDAVEYTYSVNADDDLILSTKGVNGSDSKVVAHNMSKAAYAEMAFSAAKSTCESVGGNESGAEQTCDTLLVPVVEYGTMMDDRDSKEYKTVTIGKQVWMAENLKFEASALATFDENYFYTWLAAIDVSSLSDTLGCSYTEECDISENIQGVCPDGWRLPSRADFDTLLAVLDKDAANILSVDAGGKDLYGFSADLSGYYNNYSGNHQEDGESVDFWAADNGNWRGDEYATALVVESDYLGVGEFPKDWGAAVRCVKDVE